MKLKNKASKLELDYITITKENFSLVPAGTYIRWIGSELDETYTRGAPIKYTGKTKTKPKKYYWYLESRDFKYTLYWNNIDHVLIKKNIYYELLEQKISILSANIIFLVDKLKLEKEFFKHDKKVAKAMDKKKLIRTNSTYF